MQSNQPNNVLKEHGLEMVSNYLLLHLFLAFLVGSIWITFVTFIAERFGSAVGGFVGGIPSTAAFSFFFIGLNQSSNTAVQVTSVFPLIFSFTCSFLLFYAYFAKKGFVFGFSISLLIWSLLCGLVIISGLQDFTISLLGCLIIAVTIYCLFTRLELGSFVGELNHVRAVHLAWRAIFSGSVVTLAVLLSQMVGPVLGGIFSAFPAVFTSTLFLVNQSKGLNFSRAITKPLFISAAMTVIPYSVAVRYSYPSLGIWFGTIVSYLVALPFAVMSYHLTRAEQKQS